MTEHSPSPVPHTPHGGELRLPTPPGVIRQFWIRHPWVTDSIVAGVYVLPMLIVLALEAFGAIPDPRSTAMIAVNLIVVVAMGGALLFRRHAPLAVLAATWAGLLISFPDYGEGDTLPVFFALYAVAVYRSVRAAWIGLGISIVVATGGAYLHQELLNEPWGSVSAQYGIIMLAVTLIGINIGNRRRYVLALLDRAAQLVRERDQHAQLARATERSRIAREMHDIIAHSLSVMVALADGAEALAEKDPGRSRTAMRDIAVTGRTSMTEMRRLLGVLADEAQPDAAAPDLQAAPLQPLPGTRQLSDLVESFRAAGLPTRLKLSGRPPHSPGVQLTIYRVVQESLTNALRYARHATCVTVALRTEPGLVMVTVTDDGRALPGAPSQGSGRGIIGLGQRVALYGGTLNAAPLPGGGWQVHASMVLDAGPDTDTGSDEVEGDA